MYLDAVVVEQAIRHCCEGISRPGPLTEFGLAGFVNIDNDNTVIHGARHRHSHPDVVEVIFHSIN